ncbi:Rrf2 family transcriptional regulator [Verrucomicrobiaceae bacterium 5K15]|uniref:Rrf2 family transcriptional regulator n=1 Tax=Oceaniferula flava TaxID=2800421 RepID=A0AAE2SD73_9BACT|nr:Rrf2 family transcriptional regulator [Oceaniferula flavus]MBK1854380.1 Rrf2 family transcriptional regulator [Oceaniferula flavus]MBM1135686.1 Rrf2 family transcriptional regulator [Oceaniferula flavus]
MIQIGKTAQNAISVMSYLTECQRDELGPVNSQQAADARGISKALAAKILTTLSQAGYIKGSTGPGGGYVLAQEPSSISLANVVMCFEVQNKEMMCPFGEGWCGTYKKCPLHDEIFRLKDEVQEFLNENDFGGFSEPGVTSKRTEENRLK